MLVLTRKRNESIMIGDEIELVVVDIHGDQVKIGIRAPRAVAVHRKEVYEEIQRENVLAAQGKAPALSDLGKLLKPPTNGNNHNPGK